MARVGLREAGRLAEWAVRKHVLRQRYQRIRVNDYEMFVDLRVPGVSRPLMMHGTREEDKTALMRRELTAGMTHLDLGANIGYYAVMAGRLVGPTGRVFCLEPDPRNIELLRRNVTLNGLDARVEVVPAAASDIPGTATMYQAAASNLNTLVAPGARVSAAATPERAMTVDTVTLDDFMASRGGRLNFLRMDIEGYEVDALRGGMRTLRDSPAPCKILLETHAQMYGPTRDFRAVLKDLFAMGFESKGVVSAGKAIPEAFRSRGYQPDEIFHADGFNRGFYGRVREGDVLDLVMMVPKTVRYLLLAKR